MTGEEKLGKNKKKIKRRRPAGVTFFSITVLILTAFVVFRFEALAWSAWDFSPGGTGQLGSIASDYKVGFEDRTVFHLENGYVLRAGDGYLRFYDLEARPVWEKPLHGQSVMIDGNRKSIAVAGATAGDLFLLDTDGKVMAKKFGVGRIDRIIHPSDAYLVCYMKEENVLRIFNEDLENTARIPMPDGELLDIDVSATDDFIAVSMFRLESGVYHSQILTYHLDGQAIGAINLKGKIILDIATVGSTMVGVTDEQAFAYNASNELIWEVSFDRKVKRAIVTSEGQVVVNLVRSTEDLTDTRPQNALMYIDTEGKTSQEASLDYDIEVMRRMGERTVFSAAERLYILSDNGKMEAILDTGGNLRRFEFLDNRHLALEYGDRLDIMKMN